LGTYKRLPRKKKKSGADLATFAERTYAWVMINWRKVAAASASVIVISLSALGAYEYHVWKEESGSKALAVAMLSTGPAQADALATVASEYARTAAGREAMLMLGNSWLKEGNADNAKQWFAEAADRSRGYPILKTYALHQLANLYAQAGDWEGAAQVFDRAAETKGNVINMRSRYEEARCLEELKKYDDARSLYEKIIASSDKSAQAVKALSEERLLWLAANRRIKKSS
jgi:tetratricopeptide (TPR) repeat protein